MSYDVTSLTQEVKDRAKDSSLSDSLIVTFLQDTQDAVLGHYRLPFLESLETATLSIADLTHAYPAEQQVILRLRLINGQDVVEPGYIPDAEFDDRYPNPEETDNNAPTAYTDYGRLLYWSVPLDKAYTLKMKYLRRSIQFTSGAIVPDIPVEYKQILIRGALGGVEEFRENFDIAALHARKVEDLSEDMLQRYGIRQLATPHKATLNGRQVGHIRNHR